MPFLDDYLIELFTCFKYTGVSWSIFFQSHIFAVYSEGARVRLVEIIRKVISKDDKWVMLMIFGNSYKHLTHFYKIGKSFNDNLNNFYGILDISTESNSWVYQHRVSNYSVKVGPYGLKPPWQNY